MKEHFLVALLLLLLEQLAAVDGTHLVSYTYEGGGQKAVVLVSKVWLYYKASTKLWHPRSSATKKSESVLLIPL